MVSRMVKERTKGKGKKPCGERRLDERKRKGQKQAKRKKTKERASQKENLFGKKGKMNEMVETSNEDLWWYGDDAYWNEWQYDVAQVWNSEWPVYDTSNAWDWQESWQDSWQSQTT